MNRMGVLIVLVVTLLTSACTPRKGIDEDADVLAAVVRQICLQQDMDGYYVLSSVSHTVWSSAAETIPDETMRQSLVERNRVERPLPIAATCATLKIVDGDEIDQYFNMPLESRPAGYDPWIAFYDALKGAHGFFSLSLPGYSVERDIAVVQMATACGELCGDGSFWVFRKISGQWYFDKSIHGWIS